MNKVLFITLATSAMFAGTTVIGASGAFAADQPIIPGGYHDSTPVVTTPTTYNSSKIADWCPRGDLSGNRYDNTCTGTVTTTPVTVSPTKTVTTPITAKSASPISTVTPKTTTTVKTAVKAPVVTTAPKTTTSSKTVATVTAKPVTKKTTTTTKTTAATTTKAPTTINRNAVYASVQGVIKNATNYTANPAMEAQLTSLINAERQRQGLNTLTESNFGSRSWSYKLSSQYDSTRTISHDASAVNQYNEIVTMGHSAEEAFSNFTNSYWHRYTYLMPSKTGIDSGVTCRTNPYNNTQLCAFTVRFK